MHIPFLSLYLLALHTTMITQQRGKCGRCLRRVSVEALVVGPVGSAAPINQEHLWVSLGDQ